MYPIWRSDYTLLIDLLQIIRLCGARARFFSLPLSFCYPFHVKLRMSMHINYEKVKFRVGCNYRTHWFGSYYFSLNVVSIFFSNKNERNKALRLSAEKQHIFNCFRFEFSIFVDYVCVCVCILFVFGQAFGKRTIKEKSNKTCNSNKKYENHWMLKFQRNANTTTSKINCVNIEKPRVNKWVKSFDSYIYMVHWTKMYTS